MRTLVSDRVDRPLSLFDDAAVREAEARGAEAREAKEGDVAARGAGARDATAESPAARMADTRDAKDGVVAAHGAEARDAKRDEPRGRKVAESASAPGREGAIARAAGETGGGPDAGARVDRGAARGRPDRVAGVCGGVGGESTLDEVLVAAWEGLTAQAVASCPICGDTLRARRAEGRGAGAPPIVGECGRCGTELA